MTTQIGLTKVVNGKLVAVRYMESKFERNLGDKITYEGSLMIVSVIGTDRNDVIRQLNVLIREANAIVAKRNAEMKAEFIKNNPVVVTQFDKVLLELLKNIRLGL